MTAPLRPAPATQRVQTIRWAEWVYGSRGGGLEDAAEEYHEASKLSPDFVDPGARGGRLLEVSAEMRISAARAVKRYRHAPVTALPKAEVPRASLADAVAGRRSERAFGTDPLPLERLAALLASGYGVTATLPPGQPVRAVPSGGALYPLELYVAAVRVSDLEPGLFHFDPFRHVLEHLPSDEPGKVMRDLSPYGPLLADAAAVIFVTAMFWRTRFKYGLRGYRFCLLEAGHLGQNVLLTATALGLASLPVGGLYDRRVDELLGIDGVNESVVYALSVGSRAT